MSHTVLFLEYAEQDLRNIHTHVEDQFSAAIANQVYIAIRDAILRLEDNPSLGRGIPELSKLGMTGYRCLVVEKRNKVVYQIDAGKKHIYVYLICGEREDFDAVLARRLLEI
jgi:plasmid stabilization system protein ParE